jgi:hypothetical protein
MVVISPLILDGLVALWYVPASLDSSGRMLAVPGHAGGAAAVTS